MIIDTHVHLYPPEVVHDCEKIAEREPHFGVALRCGGRLGTAEEVLAEMAEENVTEGWLCGFGFSDLGLCRACNEYAYETARNSDGRLKWLCVVPPMARGAAAEVERCAVLGAIGVGELFPDAQGWEMNESRETWRVTAACHEYGMYLLMNVAEYGGLFSEKEAYAFARNHPELSIVAACLGGGLFLREAVREERGDLYNVYYDTGSILRVYNPSILDAVFRVAPDKVLFGSDFPNLRVARYWEMLGETKLTDDDKNRLFHENAQELLTRARSGI